MTRPPVRRAARAAQLLALVAVIAVTVTGCAKRQYDSQKVRDFVDATAPNSFRFIYEVEQGGETFRVQGLIEDDLRYKLQLSIGGRPALEQVVVDDAVAVRYLAPGLVDEYIDEEARPKADLDTDVEGATVLDALKARRWVLDEVGAPPFLRTAEQANEEDKLAEEGEFRDDPLYDARTVLTYVRNVAEAQYWQEYDPESLEPTYRKDEDPFLVPEDGSGVRRFDTIVFDLPEVGSANAGTQAVFPGYAHFRRMAVYTKDGTVFSVREHTQLFPRQVEDLFEYTAAILENNSSGVVEDFRRTYAQLPEAKRAQFVLDGINTFRKAAGQAQVRFRVMAFEIQDLGDPTIRVTLPTDQVIRGSLAVLQNMGRKPTRTETDDSGTGAGSTSSTSSSSTTAPQPATGV